MEIIKSHKYNATTDAVLKKFCDRDYYMQKYKELGAQNPEILECGQDGDIFRIKTKRGVKANVPSFAKKFLKEINIVTETDEWVLGDGATKEGSYTVSVEGAPISINGEIILRPHGSGEGCEHEVKAIIVVKIPLVGKKIAKLVGDDTSDSLDEEFAYNAKHIS